MKKNMISKMTKDDLIWVDDDNLKMFRENKSIIEADDYAENVIDKSHSRDVNGIHWILKCSREDTRVIIFL